MPGRGWRVEEGPRGRHARDEVASGAQLESGGAEARGLQGALEGLGADAAATKKGRLASPSGNRTPVSRVTGGDTHHYTNEDGGARRRGAGPLSDA